MKLNLLALSLFFLFLPLSFAETVDVGLYVLNLGKYDVSTGSFTADFYLSLKCENECNTDFEFMNGRATSVDKSIDEPNEKFYRIQATLNSPVDLQKFPFDSQKMQIILEDKTNTIEDVTYNPNLGESGLDSTIAFTGWNIDSWTAQVREHNYDIYGETFSQYVFSIDISRIAFNSFFKTFMPVFVMVLIVMFSFIMDTDKIATRLTITTSSLVAAVMFHISISNQIPPVGYLTTADKFMFLTYCLFLAAAILNIAILELLERKQQENAEKWHRRTEYSVFIAVPVIYLVFFLFFGF